MSYREICFEEEQGPVVEGILQSYAYLRQEEDSLLSANAMALRRDILLYCWALLDLSPLFSYSVTMEPLSYSGMFFRTKLQERAIARFAIVMEEEQVNFKRFGAGSAFVFFPEAFENPPIQFEGGSKLFVCTVLRMESWTHWWSLLQGFVTGRGHTANGDLRPKPKKGVTSDQTMWNITNLGNTIRRQSFLDRVMRETSGSFLPVLADFCPHPFLFDLFLEIDPLNSL